LGPPYWWQYAECLQKFVFLDFNRFGFARGFGFCIYVVPFAEGGAGMA